MLAPYILKYAPWLKISRQWIIPFTPLLIVFAVYFLRFYLQLPRATRLRFTLAGAIFITGAIGVEVFGKWYTTTMQPELFYGRLFSVTEEAMEMLGIVFFIRALLIYIRENVQPAAITLHVEVPTKEPKREGHITIATKAGAESKVQ